MKVAELIDILKELPQDMPVTLAYDSFVCHYDVEKSTIVFVENGDENWNRQVILCAMSDDSVHWHVYEADADDRIPGRTLAQPEG
jgi:hypothetical protein